MKGDVLHARNLDSMVLGVSNLSGKGEEHVGECSKGSTRESLFMEQQSWTSLQYSEAKTIFKDIMTEASARKCGKCGAKNPKISCPGFCLLYKVLGKHLDTCWQFLMLFFGVSISVLYDYIFQLKC